jgi:formate dehydrogenase major subunit
VLSFEQSKRREQDGRQSRNLHKTQHGNRPPEDAFASWLSVTGATELGSAKHNLSNGLRGMPMKMTRRGFIKLTGAGLAASGMGALGFGHVGEALASSVRAFKLAATKETRNTCTYCSVACGILIYSMGDQAKNARSNIIHIEGDPDHPVNRGTLCPKGAGLLDIVHAPTRLTAPRYRAPGTSEFKDVSWDFALDRIARLMKDDRDKNFIARNKDGATVNRWTSVGMLAASASSNETAFLTWKVARSLGMVVFDNQARV